MSELFFDHITQRMVTIRRRRLLDHLYDPRSDTALLIDIVRRLSQQERTGSVAD